MPRGTVRSWHQDIAVLALPCSASVRSDPAAPEDQASPAGSNASTAAQARSFGSPDLSPRDGQPAAQQQHQHQQHQPSPAQQPMSSPSVYSELASASQSSFPSPTSAIVNAVLGDIHRDLQQQALQQAQEREDEQVLAEAQQQQLQQRLQQEQALALMEIQWHGQRPGSPHEASSQPYHSTLQVTPSSSGFKFDTSPEVLSRQAGLATPSAAAKQLHAAARQLVPASQQQQQPQEKPPSNWRTIFAAAEANPGATLQQLSLAGLRKPKPGSPTKAGAKHGQRSTVQAHAGSMPSSPNAAGQPGGSPRSPGKGSSSSSPGRTGMRGVDAAATAKENTLK